MDTIGNRMRALRLNEGMTQNEVAGKSGISENYYSRIETGKNSPSLEKLTAIAKTLGVSLFHLLNDRIEEMEDRVEIEEGRLCDIFKSIPDHQFQLVQGLIKQAARLRVLLDDNWKDILENGEYEKFSQSEAQTPYDRKRPIVENYDNRDKTYQNIIRQLTELLPKEGPPKKNQRGKLLGR